MPTLHLLAAAAIGVICGLGSTAATAQAATDAAPAARCATIEVHHVRPGQGLLMLAAYGDAQSFGKKPMAVRRLPAAQDAVMRTELCGLSGDTVALMLYQDLDSDGQMGRNLVGMPLEPWGGSGTPGMFGPSWETGRVALDGQAIVVRMSQ